uniref:T-complex protein 1 subunit gamma n=1 Tax=Saccharomyces cerevisiae TaxID=4932 RepID=UPI0002177BD3|nr:Chain c, T-complex protein 1 subunit gamma [Saccharomyces cerevisiae]3P9E_k Chain k, T-complex protein 1 subunit gamma [Saccharomyces cerevisiae]4D8R_c Chain c, T-complex protein 1 subunit gamma [Saccharomyces cerevisiae S288C]4D8R_k Chain k, T-complex protein 1 subunit gamma [Saccharomyces cerevisiae S288C]4V81_C Chain C, T-complex protein 1 subunit gamma [Saccharomyces cerevisiae]4V81_K Chain K, T-complex protein 1 subunit gamma [Saccharomyces cerevisiae]4V81_c Chain c, T-complex protein
MQAPVVFMNASQERTTGRQAQISNITAAKAVADVIRTCLGPKAMLKMLLDPMGGLVLTNDGHAILREIDVAHPAAKSMLELSRTQDEEVGDGTTTVIILAGEILAQCAPYLIEKNIHPVIIIQALKKALTDALEVIKQVSKPVDVENDAAMKKLIQASIGTKYVIHWSEKMCELALDAVKTVRKDLGQTVEGEPNFEIDIKRYVRVEKIPGGDVLDSRVLKGVLLNKDVVHPKMSRHIENPRVVLLDCPLEYKKGESQTNIEIEKEEDWNRILQIEEEQVQLMCEQILAVRPTLVITEKGVSDLAQHYLLKGGCSVLRRVKKSDNNRIARVTGATIVNRVEDLKESDVGTNCGLFKVEMIGDEYFSFLDNCKEPGSGSGWSHPQFEKGSGKRRWKKNFIAVSAANRFKKISSSGALGSGHHHHHHHHGSGKACTIMLRGGSKDILNEIDRNLQDAMAVARNVMLSPSLSPGGGATEMAVSVKLAEKAKQLEGIQQWPYQAVADAMECIPRTLIQNAGGDPIRLLSQLRAKHAQGNFTTGIDGDKGKIVDMVSYGIWEPEVIKQQSVKTAIESACLLLRVDDIVSGVRKQE